MRCLSKNGAVLLIEKRNARAADCVEIKKRELGLRMLPRYARREQQYSGVVDKGLG